jgi:hypothetical protein
LGEHHHSTDKYVHDLRIKLANEFPGVTFAFLPADIVSQILNFGLPAPIDVQIVGNDLEGNRKFADTLLQKVRYIPGTVDLRIQQPFDQPKLHVNVDRTKAGQIGFTERDVAQNLLISLSGSFQTSPTFWLNPKNGVSYPIATQTPQYRLDSLQGLQNIPVAGAAVRRANSGKSCFDSARSGIRRGVALRYRSRHRHLRVGAGARPGRRFARSEQNPGFQPQGLAEGIAHGGPRADSHDAIVVYRADWGLVA